MLSLLGQTETSCDRVARRELLRIGGISLGGLTLDRLFRARAEAATSLPKVRAKSVIILFNSGGIPHHETWDPKPDAPREIRGDFGTIATRTPGLMVGELMPRTAQLTQHIAVIRSLVTGDNAHSTSGYQMMTGVPHVPLSRENALPGTPNDCPSVNAFVQRLRGPSGGIPAAITMPRRLANFDGLYPWPGSDAGSLGQAYDPWLLECDPSQADFSVPGCTAPADLPPLRVDHRKTLLQQLDQHLAAAEERPNLADFDRYQQQAMDLVAGSQARRAFRLDEEPAAVRDRYGRSKHGQCVLLARRLVEAGVSLVQVNWASHDKQLPNGGGWDTHEKHSESLRGWLMPRMDQTYSALLEDLQQRGLLEQTLVCWVAEFGHTPKINARAGRDHWGRVFSIALAGGGIRGGTVLGASDRHGAEPQDTPIRPGDYLATVLHCLGLPTDQIVEDRTGRPIPVARGRVLESLLTSS